MCKGEQLVQKARVKTDCKRASYTSRNFPFLLLLAPLTLCFSGTSTASLLTYDIHAQDITKLTTTTALHISKMANSLERMQQMHDKARKVHDFVNEHKDAQINGTPTSEISHQALLLWKNTEEAIR